MQSQEEILPALEQILTVRKRVIVLVRDVSQSTAAADALRAHLAGTDLGPKVKPSGRNADFVKLSTGAWAFFIACTELAPDEDVGQPDFVLWPTEGGVYATVTHSDWKAVRTQSDSPWRPLAVFDDAEPVEPDSVWDRLVSDKDFG